MPTYRFVKIVDNENPSDFMIDVTSMSNWKSRMSAVRTQCIRHIDYNIGKNRDIYRFFFLDYSFYCLERRDFDNLADARKYREQLHQAVIDKRKQLKEISRYNI